MDLNWRVTPKRRENVVKVCLNLLTVDCAGLLAPIVLKQEGYNGIIFFAAVVGAIILASAIYFLES